MRLFSHRHYLEDLTMEDILNVILRSWCEISTYFNDPADSENLHLHLLPINVSHLD